MFLHESLCCGYSINESSDTSTSNDIYDMCSLTNSIIIIHMIKEKLCRSEETDIQVIEYIFLQDKLYIYFKKAHIIDIHWKRLMTLSHTTTQLPGSWDQLAKR